MVNLFGFFPTGHLRDEDIGEGTSRRGGFEGGRQDNAGGRCEPSFASLPQGGTMRTLGAMLGFLN